MYCIDWIITRFNYTRVCWWRDGQDWTGRPLIIQHSYGGGVIEFRLRGLALKRDKVPIIVDGACFSACSMIVDENRENVCITTTAVLGYHKQHWMDTDKKMHYALVEIWNSRAKWILLTRGGEPTEDLMLMDFTEAKKFYSLVQAQKLLILFAFQEVFNKLFGSFVLICSD